MTVLVILAVAVLAIVLAIVLSDRVIAGVAEQRAAQFLTTPLGGPATVRVHGSPFVTQAIRGRYADVEVTSSGLRIGDMSGATLQAQLSNVYLPLRALLGGRVTEVPCEHVRGTVVLPYTDLARASRIPSLVLAFDGLRLRASAALPIPGISQLSRIAGEAQLSVTDTGVWLRVRGISVAGISVPSIVLSQLMPALSVPIPLPPLPYGLRIDGLDPTAAGLAVHGSAPAAVFRSPSRPSA